MCGALSVVALFDSLHLIYDANEMRKTMKRKNHKKVEGGGYLREFRDRRWWITLKEAIRAISLMNSITTVVF